MKTLIKLLLAFGLVFQVSLVKSQEEKQNAEETENTEVSQENATPQVVQPTLQTYSKFDFIAGEKVIFFDDFSQDAIGDFPALWNTDGSGEVVTTNNFPGKWFHFTGEGSFIPMTGAAFPDNFTVEFDVVPDKEARIGFYFYEAENPNDFNEGGAIPGKSGIKMWFGAYDQSYSAYTDGGYTLDGNTEKVQLKPFQLTRFSVWVQKQRVRVYFNETKIFDLPRVLPLGIKCNVIRFMNDGEAQPMISNIRIAVGQPDMRSKLITEGKLVTYGINFDVNSDKLKPESYGTLKEIAKVLTENPEVRVKIVGHTDSDGADAANLDLSKRRALSVKNELGKSFAIETSRLETDGKGESVPIAPNDTPSNKALNRRVELIKL
jgi:OmpA-OmpF porin, OOP family